MCVRAFVCVYVFVSMYACVVKNEWKYLRYNALDTCQTNTKAYIITSTLDKIQTIVG